MPSGASSVLGVLCSGVEELWTFGWVVLEGSWYGPLGMVSWNGAVGMLMLEGSSLKCSWNGGTGGLMECSWNSGALGVVLSEGSRS